LEDEAAKIESSDGSPSDGVLEEDKESTALERFRPIVSPSADLFHPSIAALRTGDLAFQLFILNDPSNAVGSILHEAGVDAFTAVVSPPYF
jgi:hypothetical protein